MLRVVGDCDWSAPAVTDLLVVLVVKWVCLQARGL